MTTGFLLQSSLLMLGITLDTKQLMPCADSGATLL